MKVKFAKFAAPVLVLATALGLGACGRVQQMTSSTAHGVVRSGAETEIVAGCPTLIANTLNTAFDFNVEAGMVASYRPGNRLRIETFGDAAEVPISAIGPCAATDIPTINFVRGHANVFLSGTTTSITSTGQALTFGALLFPGAALEPGVVVTNDAEGNVLEIIWPDLSGLGPGSPIVRVQLAVWDEALVNAGSSVDVTWDLTASDGVVETNYRGHCEGMALDGTAVVPGGAAIPPCPTTLAGTGGTVANLAADIVQFRSNRLRVEVIGDVASGAINATGACAATDVPTIDYVGGTANMFQAGTTSSVTSSGGELVFGPLLFPGALLEPGVVVAQDADRNVLEIIWPGLSGLPPGAPILRFQARRYNSWVRTGRAIDVRMRFDARANDGSTASYAVAADGLVLPVRR